MFKDDGFRRARIATLTAFLINGFSVGTFVSRIPDFKTGLSISDGILGASLFCASVGVLAALAPVSKAAAKFGSGPVVRNSAFTLALATPLVSLLFNLSWFWLSLFIYGFLSSAHDLSMNAQAAALENKAGKRVMSTFHALWSVGCLTGGAIGGIAAAAGISLRVHMFSVGILIFLVGLAIRSSFLPGADDRHEVGEKKRKKFPRKFYVLGLLGLCGALGEGAASDWGGILARDTYHASPFLISLPYVLYSITMVTGRFSGDFIANKFGAIKLLTFSGLIAGGGILTGLLINNIYGVLLAWVLLGLGVSTVIPMMISTTGTIANEKYAGEISAAQGVAVVTGIAYFGFVLGPPLLGQLSDLITLRWAMLIPAGLAILLSVSVKKVLTS